MAQLVLCSHDAGGTVPPMLALAEAAVRRGHDVVWLGQPSIGARADAAGARFVAFDGIGDYEPGVAIEDQLDVVGPLTVGVGPGEQLQAVAADAELVVVDANLAGCLAVAEALPAPSAVLLHSMLASFTRTWFADYWPFLEAPINETRRHFGQPDATSWIDVFSRHDRAIAVVPRSFDDPDSGDLARLRHAGFLVPTATPGPRPDGDGPLVLVALSTTFQGQEGLLGAVLESLGTLPVRGLASTAGQVDAASLHCPPNVRLQDRIDHGAVLPHTDVVVTHAGLGTVAAALQQGVPLVCTPLGRDQHLNADRVAALGAGIVLAAASSSEQIADAVEQVRTDPSFRAAARTVAAGSRAAGGADATVADLESLLGD